MDGKIDHFANDPLDGYRIDPETGKYRLIPQGPAAGDEPPLVTPELVEYLRKQFPDSLSRVDTSRTDSTVYTLGLAVGQVALITHLETLLEKAPK